MDQIISLVLGSLASYLQGEKTKHLSPSVRFALSLVFSAAAGLVATVFGIWEQGGSLSKEEIFANLATAFASSQLYYNIHFKLAK